VSWNKLKIFFGENQIFVVKLCNTPGVCRHIPMIYHAGFLILVFLIGSELTVIVFFNNILK